MDDDTLAHRVKSGWSENKDEETQRSSKEKLISWKKTQKHTRRVIWTARKNVNGHVDSR